MARDVAVVKPTKAIDIEREAWQTLNSFQPTALRRAEAVNVERFFEGRLPKIANVKTDYRKLSHGIMGWTDSELMEVVVSLALVETNVQSERRRGRATIVHECDHAIRHIPQFRQRRAILKSIHDKKHSQFRLFRQEDVPAYCNPEWQSWRWGKAFIMPLQIIIGLYESGATEYEMAEIFDVNPAFVRSRLGDLERMGLIKPANVARHSLA